MMIRSPLTKFTLNNNKLILHKAILNPNFSSNIQQLPNFRTKLLACYKQLYRLRNVIDEGSYRSKFPYENMIRRNFERISFNTRRQAVLGHINQDSEVTVLTENEIIERLMNTVVFVFNSTVQRQNEFADMEIQYYEDLKKSNTDTLEKNIVNTVIRMDGQKPNSIKYDFKYNWIRDYTNNIQDHIKLIEAKPNQKKYEGSFELDYIGFRNYEFMIMSLNENMKLCL
ncbi:hypothetical protein DFJ63DRAFT_56411 [Scheffersomyces coipomensis]|uniref:uncharacterized protein n=1 Tax=Scheffersomyces coipomensis TaxID=1788519 RepID=UPI00315DCD1E